MEKMSSARPLGGGACRDRVHLGSRELSVEQCIVGPLALARKSGGFTVEPN